jgi:hypothetical protein
MRHEIDDEVVTQIFAPEEKTEKIPSKCEKIATNMPKSPLNPKKVSLNMEKSNPTQAVPEHDALTPEEISEAIREHKTMKKFLGDLSDFLASNKERFPDLETLLKPARIAWKDRLILDAIGFGEYRENDRLFYIPAIFFEEMIFPLQLQHCLGFLLSRNLLHSKNGQIVFKRWFKGLKTEFYVIKSKK